MLDNKETQPFADQRLTELIKEALCVEQEVAIEGLKKQALALQGQKEIALAQKEAVQRDLHRYQQEIQSVKVEMGQLQQHIQVEMQRKKTKARTKSEALFTDLQTCQAQLEASRLEKERLFAIVKDLERQIAGPGKAQECNIAELRAANEELQSRVHSLTAELRDTQLANERDLAAKFQELKEIAKESKKAFKASLRQELVELRAKHDAEL